MRGRRSFEGILSIRGGVSVVMRRRRGVVGGSMVDVDGPGVNKRVDEDHRSSDAACLWLHEAASIEVVVVVERRRDLKLPFTESHQIQRLALKGFRVPAPLKHNLQTYI